MMLDGASLVGETGSILEAGGNKPVQLDRTDRIWLVEGGHVDVFTLRLEAGRISGARQPFFTVPEGDILLGADPAATGAGRGMLAVGGFGTRLREIDAAAFMELGIDPSKADDIQRLLRRWIRNAALAVGGREAMPRNSRDLAGSGRIPLAQGGTVHPYFRTIWVRVESGRAAFMGREDFPAVEGNRPFPLARGTWLEAMDEVVLSYTEEWPSIAWGNLRQTLGTFCGFIMECAAANVLRTEAEERARMEGREEARRSMLEQGIARFASIMRTRRLAADLETDRREPLLAACRIVAEASGFEVRTSWNGKPAPGSPESLDEIVRASGFRTRQVLLKGDWWKRDSGALLVYRETDQRPMAAIQSSRRSYELLDPVDGSAQGISRSVAESLDSHAQVFYRPLPNRRVRGWDLLSLGARGCSRDIGTALLAGLGGALLGLLLPWMTGLLFDTVIPEAKGGQLLQVAAILLLAATATLLFDITRGIALLRIEGRMDSSVQAALWDRLLSLPVTFFANYTAGDLAERSMGISSIRRIASSAVVDTVVACIFSLANLALMFHYEAGMAWFALALFALGLAFILCVSLALLRYQRRVVELKGKNQGIVLQLITGMAKLRVSSSENGAFSLWARSYAEMKKHAYQAGRLQTVLDTFGATYPILALMAIIMWMAAKDWGGLSPGGYLAFSSAFLMLQNALLQLGAVAVSSLGIFPVYDRLKPILETAPEADETKDKPGCLSGRIEVSHLSFRYQQDGPLVLKDVCLSVEPGEFIAIVGGSGSGKSTLLRLLLGFARPEAGAIYYDRQDLDSLDAHAVRRQIGVVLQNGQLMSGDIAKAILGSSKLTLDDAWEAARMVGLDQDIKDMPMGIHTMIPAGGSTLSGGQRQRLLIARAVVRKPRMLFFDEATSALDNRTQAIVGQSLEGLQVSSIVIAHRLSTIVHADRIYVMDRGEVAEQGSYSELMEMDGIFAKMARRQSA
jgi:NHLM bacteriocin system ABC transporter ATP-binding protein